MKNLKKEHEKFFKVRAFFLLISWVMVFIVM